MIRLSKLTFIPKRLLKTFAILLITSVVAIAAGRKLIFSQKAAKAKQEDAITSLNTGGSGIDEFIPPSPEVSALGKFIETPIGYKTGTPNINIPIHTVQDGSLQVPISLSYHASGIKASDVATWVGSGWNLNAGGQIFRTVRGLPDEQSNGYYFTGSSLDLDNLSSNAANSVSNKTFEHINYANMQTVMDVTNRFADGEPDIFRFILPNGKNGRFYINKAHEVIQIPKQSIDIKYSSPQTSNKFTQFTITDTDGTKFIFGTKYPQGGPRYVEKIITDPNIPDTEVAWKLVEMKDYNENESINFNYVQEDYSYYIPRTASQLDVRPAQYTNSTTTSSSNLSVKYQGSVNTVALGLDAVDYSSYKLSSISANYETVNFISNTNRVDSDFKNGTPKKLDKIEILKGTLCKSFNLSHDYFKDPNDPSIDTKLKLLSLQEVTCNTNNIKSKPPYNFHYDGTSLPDARNRAIDHWGYYNGAHGNPTFNIPSTSVPLPQSLGGGYLTKGYSNRNPNEVYMKKGSLTKIDFPTGGFTEYTYEAHEYWDDDSQTNLKAGGLRIAQKKHNDGNGNDILTTTYDYSADVNQSSGYLFDKPKYFYKKGFAIGSTAGFLVSWRNTPINHMSDYDGSHILYSKVTERISGNGSTTYKFGNIGSTYNFSSTTLLGQTGYPQAPLMHYPFRGSLENIELKSEDNTSVGNTAFNPIQNVPFEVGDECLAVGEKHSFITYASVQLTTVYYTPRRYKIYTSDPYRLQSVTKTQDGVTTTTEYEYDTEFPSFVKKAKTTIDGDEYTNEYIYPNINSTGQEGTLYSKNRVVIPLEVYSLKNDKIISATKTTYKNTGVAKIVPDKIYSSESNTLLSNPNWVHKATMLSHDMKGNLTEFARVNDISTSIIWNNQQDFPIAKVINASPLELFYTSFEEDISGIIGTTNNPKAQTGVKSHIGSYTINISNLSLNSNEEYTLSFWQSSAGDDWKYQERTITPNGNNIVVTPNNGNNYIDEVRLYPSDALMTTICFDENTYAITHSMDANNNLITYEYDDFNRIENIYDFEGNLIKHHEYNYHDENKTDNRQYNYVKQWVFLEEGVNKYDNFDAMASEDKIEAIKFLDGLGRTTQTIGIDMAANGGDIVNHIEYDALGRRSKQFMPYVVGTGTNNGTFSTNAKNKQRIYNISKYSTDKSFAETIFDNSPLNRVMEQGNVGQEWQIGTGHTKKLSHGTNAGGVVRNLQNGGTYAANELYVVTLIDENDKEATVYKDRLGRTIMISRKLEITIGNSTTIEYAKTYYQYDDFGRIKRVYTPEGTKAMDATGWSASSPAAELVYEYQYDARGRMVSKKIPSVKEMKIIYDKLDRPVLVQDGELQKNKDWLFTKYDIFGRPVLKGVFTNDNNDGQTTLKTSVNASPLYETISNANTTGYTNLVFPTTYTDNHNISYYDNYDFNRDNTGDFGIIPQLNYTGADQSDRIKGQLTGSKVKVLGSSPKKWLNTVIFYDKRGQAIQIQGENHLNGWDVMTSEYDFSGKVMRSERQHTVAEQLKPLYVVSTFNYDGTGRMKEIRYGVGDASISGTTPPLILNAYEYDDIGQVIEKKLHSMNNGRNYLQNIDYKYNIRGWLTDINDVNFGGLSAVQMAEEVTKGLISKVKDSDIEIDINIADLNAGIYDEIKVENTRTEEKAGTTENRHDEKNIELEQNVTLQSVLTDVLSLDYNGQELNEGNYEQEFDKLKTDLDTQMDNLGITDQKARDLLYDEVTSYLKNDWLQTVANDNDDDLFAMHIDYTTSNTETQAEAQFNGNISQTKWRVRGDDRVSTYGFQYDDFNRLTQAKYAEYDENGTYSQHDNYTVSNISYDLNGNIETLNRNGFTGTGFSQIDQMNYSYKAGTNELDAITGDVNTAKGFKGNSTLSTNQYTYDDNGRMITDDNKGIAVTYNHLNLPIKIEFVQFANKKIELEYDAAGIKLSKKVTNGTTVTYTQYVGGIEYKGIIGGLTIESVYHSDGRFITANGGLTYQQEYVLRDQQGSSRVVFCDDDNNGVVEESEIREKAHYYPFGMRMEAPLNQQTANYKKLDNGKELTDDLGLDWYDYNARWYDPAMARWNTIDPLAETMASWSPYNYVFNNPITYTDPSGMSPESDKEDGDWAAPTELESKSIKPLKVDNEIEIKTDFSKPENEATYYKNLVSEQLDTESFTILFGFLNTLDGTLVVRDYTDTEEEKLSKDINKGRGTLANYNRWKHEVAFSFKNSGGISPATIFEEFFHAGQIGWYGNGYITLLKIETEARVAVAYNAYLEYSCAEICTIEEDRAFTTFLYDNYPNYYLYIKPFLMGDFNSATGYNPVVQQYFESIKNGNVISNDLKSKFKEEVLKMSKRYSEENGGIGISNWRDKFYDGRTSFFNDLYGAKFSQ